MTTLTIFLKGQLAPIDAGVEYRLFSATVQVEIEIQLDICDRGGKEAVLDAGINGCKLTFEEDGQCGHLVQSPNLYCGGGVVEEKRKQVLGNMGDPRDDVSPMANDGSSPCPYIDIGEPAPNVPSDPGEGRE
ncbi:hypothetical protein BU17DRAFT_72457 [Hysterangium stoloniferum]|nr:hypothetical protein BU17DRAFT_72457 [Hysterangium stoloniferum]